MKLGEIIVAAATVASAVAGPAKKRASKFQFVGVNESGAEFGNTALPGQLGKDYTWPDQNAINVSDRRLFTIKRRHDKRGFTLIFLYVYRR